MFPRVDSNGGSQADNSMACVIKTSLSKVKDQLDVSLVLHAYTRIIIFVSTLSHGIRH